MLNVHEAKETVYVSPDGLLDSGGRSSGKEILREKLEVRGLMFSYREYLQNTEKQIWMQYSTNPLI